MAITANTIAPPNKAMEPTEQGGCCHGFFQALRKRSVRCRRLPGLAGASTNILPPRLIAGR
jgi:hypothetical protein